MSTIQRLLYCPHNGSNHLGIILAACGSTIFSFGANDGFMLSKWSHKNRMSLPATGTASTDLSDLKNGSNDHSSKRRKLSSASNSDCPSAEIVVESGSKRTRKPKAKLIPSSAIVKLCCTSDAQHVVAVTSEDKCVRVLQLLEDGSLNQLSERCMPKKPSAVSLTTDQKTILCADKFGDVYSLPLLVSSIGKSSSHPRSKATVERPYVPSANSLTVHTKKNRLALQNQLKVPRDRVVERKAVEFDHQFLLGHVSLLTDLVHVTVPGPKGQRRSYIVTADRDEHIRMTRGIPQTHIIEGFCLGHTQFISKICLVPWNQEYLISAGGDDYAALWHWPSRTLVQKIDLRELMNQGLEARKSSTEMPGNEKAGHDEEPRSIAVSGIWFVPDQSASPTREGNLIISLVAVPLLLVYSISSDHRAKSQSPIHLDANLYDLTVLPDSRSILCSTSGGSSLTQFKYHDHGRWIKETNSDGPAAKIWKSISSQDVEGMSEDELQELLYGIEKLRKHGLDEGDQSSVV